MTILRVCFALVLSAGSASAQTVYKCTGSDGKIAYGEAPCAAGQTVELNVPATPAWDGKATLARQRKEAARLEKERHGRDARDERVQERSAKAAAGYRKKCATLKLNKKWADEDAAHDHNSARAKLKARRGAEKLALECPD